jgi:hypothetical protein
MLLNDDLLKRFQEQGYTGDKPSDKVKIVCKFFNPAGSGAWYVTEYYPDDKVFFGYANLGDTDCAELGYISLAELEAYRSPIGTRIERDVHFGYEHSLKEVLDSKGTI